MSSKKNTQQFIEESRLIHGNKYDYSLVDYQHSGKHITITCPIHGEFQQQPSQHLRGKGCPQCGKQQHQKTQEKFIEQCHSLYNGKYDYSKVEYVNNKTKICIICPEHGEFWKAPIKHLNDRQGCPKCRDSKPKPLQSKLPTIDERKQSFIERANIIHKNKYDYSNVDYVNTHTKVCIICPEHGKFWQTPHHHLDNRGCPKCGHHSVDINDFTIKARKIHNDKYDYSKSTYINTTTPITIICPKHGEFKQTPQHHLLGCKCPMCSKEINVAETKLFELIKSAFPTLNWIHSYRNKKFLNKQELDIFNEKYSIAIEYQGKQHFSNVEYFKSDFNIIHERDLRKINVCQNNNIKLFHFTYNPKDISNDIEYQVITNEGELIKQIREYINEKEKHLYR